jgi:hypothetical protein
MTVPTTDGVDAAAEIATAVLDYGRDDDLGTLLDRLRRLSSRVSPAALAAAAEPFRDVPEVVIPVYEHLVSVRPSDARAIVILANAYWLTGRGPDVVQALAQRATQADPTNRGAWHLWALSTPDPRTRVERWRDVTTRFPADQLARAALADNAASLAGAERDPLALDLAIVTYEQLLHESADPAQRTALESAIATLRAWRV